MLTALNVNNDGYVESSIKPPKTTLKVDNTLDELAEWKKANPNSSINDFYRKKVSK
ncbi:MAG TPA: hypothetical protein VFF15_00510 [Flavobacteriaceae bacterium]|nr:hypothetical protein [Flavobacteriaceae bacterium]